MSLGDYFPEAAREEAAARHLLPGAVLYLPFTFPGEARAKEKYMVVVAAVSPKLVLLTINTDVNPFTASRPELNRCNVVIPQDEHDFLDYDSNLACHQAQIANEKETAALLNAEPARYCGVISRPIRRAILGVMATQPRSISKVMRDAIIAGLALPEAE